MPIAISNIAWDICDDSIMQPLLQSYNIKHVDIAPLKYFPSTNETTLEMIKHFKTEWAEFDIQFNSMQSLFFGMPNLNIFSDTATQNKIIEHFNRLFFIANHLGITSLVFGSPKNRDATGLSTDESSKIAVSFFRQLGTFATQYNVLICLEPNPECYGANFLTTTHETAEIVKRINMPTVKLQFDTGSLTINNENPFDILKNYSHLVGHIHISEPNLAPIGRHETDHDKMSSALTKYLPNKIYTIEMRKPEYNAIDIIKQSIETTKRYYK